MRQWTDEQKALAKAVFGRPVRVLLAGWILEREGAPFFQQEAALALAAAHGEAQSATAQELQRFVEWGLLERLEPAGSERKVWYHVDKQHRLWTVLSAAAVCFGLLGPSDRHGAHSSTYPVDT